MVKRAEAMIFVAGAIYTFRWHLGVTGDEARKRHNNLRGPDLSTALSSQLPKDAPFRFSCSGEDCFYYQNHADRSGREGHSPHYL